MAEALWDKEILVNGHSIVFGEELVQSMKLDPSVQGFTLEVVPQSVVQILRDMPSSDFDFLSKEWRPAILTPQQTVMKARQMALSLMG